MMHVYPQHHWHDEVVILGNKKALLELGMCLVNLAKQEGEFGSVETAPLFTADGEGYTIKLRRYDGPMHSETDDEDWQIWRLPYVDPEARDRREDTALPF